MKICLLFLFSSLLFSCGINDNKNKVNEYGLVFSNEEIVLINGYTDSAMEPFISKNGLKLFFNSLNDNVDTSLYYAIKNDYKTFTLAGKIGNVNGNKPHLDAVSSMDKNEVFYFVTTRNYINSFENLYTGIYTDGNVSNIQPVKGDIYVESPGNIIMDAEINSDGIFLYFVNSYFSDGNLISSKIGIAKKVDNGFSRIINEKELLQQVNISGYLTYAPSISSDQLELYITRLNKQNNKVEICVYTRNANNEIFSNPLVIDISGAMAEAVTITNDMDRIYYHKKEKIEDKYSLYTMKRTKKQK